MRKRNLAALKGKADAEEMPRIRNAPKRGREKRRKIRVTDESCVELHTGQRRIDYPTGLQPGQRRINYPSGWITAGPAEDQVSKWLNYSSGGSCVNVDDWHVGQPRTLLKLRTVCWSIKGYGLPHESFKQPHFGSLILIIFCVENFFWTKLKFSRFICLGDIKRQCKKQQICFLW